MLIPGAAFFDSFSLTSRTPFLSKPSFDDSSLHSLALSLSPHSLALSLSLYSAISFAGGLSFPTYLSRQRPVSNASNFMAAQTTNLEHLTTVLAPSAFTGGQPPPGKYLVTQFANWGILILKFGKPNLQIRSQTISVAGALCVTLSLRPWQ